MIKIIMKETTSTFKCSHNFTCHSPSPLEDSKTSGKWGCVRRWEKERDIPYTRVKKVLVQKLHASSYNRASERIETVLEDVSRQNTEETLR